MSRVSTPTEKRLRSKRKIRARLSGTSERPRLSVFRSNRFIYAQVIDDMKGITLASASDATDTKGKKTERAALVGTRVAESAKKQGVTKVVFDRNGRKYIGRVKALADAARTAGLEF